MSYVKRSSWKNRSSGISAAPGPGRRLKKIIIFLLLLFVFFEFISGIFITSFEAGSISMEPTVPSGALVLASPLILNPELPFSGKNIPGIRKPNRGDLVICEPAYMPEKAWYIITIDAFIRFFTLQKKGFGSNPDDWADSLMIKRVIAIPGDTVRMENMEILIKPEGRNYFFNEKEIMQTEYFVEKYSLPGKLPVDFPLSGRMEAITLGTDEYFLIGDNRAMSNDSYHWGPLPLEKIKASVFLQYVPEIRILQ